jgi:hydrogenase maturation protein HypF
MAEHGVDEIVGIICDGFGLGFEGGAWGGEILACHGSDVKRVVHLEEQPMVGGDLATRYPVRMVAGILRRDPTIQHWLRATASRLPHGEAELSTINNQLEKQDFTWTSSCGRILDAVAAILGICYERTYEGEPAMKLEAHARAGKDRINIALTINGELIRTSNMVQEIYDHRNKLEARDLAASAHSYIAQALAQAAIMASEKEGIKTVGFSGGVALNERIATMIRKIITESGLRYVSNVAVPPGDGGIALGQSYLATIE